MGRLLTGLLLLAAGCGDQYLIVSVAGVPGDATMLVVSSTLDDQPADDEPFSAPAGGFGDSTSFALRVGGGSPHRFSAIVEARRDDGCVVSQSVIDQSLSGGRMAIAIALVPVTDCTGGSRTPGMVRIPAGTFLMGCNEAIDSDCFDDERPARMVTISHEFEIDRTEVSVAAYQGCVSAGACSSPSTAQSRGLTAQAYVSWNQASAYCAFRQKRLLTEAEWEWAARAPDNRRYPWGADPASCTRAIYAGPDPTVGPNCWDRDDSPIAPVGSHPDGASFYGVLDLGGNVSEWVADWYAIYPDGPATDPPGPADGLQKIVRGGSWQLSVRGVRTSARFFNTPDGNASPSVVGLTDEENRWMLGIRCGR